jgi:hypothetical protein
MKRNGSWGDLRKELNPLPVAQLIAIIRDLRDLSEPNREFLDARVRGGSGMVEIYRRRIVEAVFPGPRSRRPVRLAEAEATVRQYSRATSDAAGTADLLLSLVEAGAEQGVDLGYGDDRYFGALLRIAQRIVDVMPDLPTAAYADIAARLGAVSQRASGHGYGFGDGLADIVDRVRTARKRARSRLSSPRTG